jgi:hypothetical protein
VSRAWPREVELASRSRSDGLGEFGERMRDSEMMVSRVDAECVVAAPDVLHQRVTAHDHACGVVALSPRIGRRRALGGPWSASIRLFAYWAVFWKLSGRNSSITARSGQARSVTTSLGPP